MANPTRKDGEPRKSSIVQAILPDDAPLAKCMKELILIRKMRKYTQQDIADLMGVTLSAISKMEQGIRSPSLHSLEMYATIVGGEIGVVNWG